MKNNEVLHNMLAHLKTKVEDKWTLILSWEVLIFLINLKLS